MPEFCHAFVLFSSATEDDFCRVLIQRMLIWFLLTSSAVAPRQLLYASFFASEYGDGSCLTFVTWR